MYVPAKNASVISLIIVVPINFFITQSLKKKKNKRNLIFPAVS